MILRASSNADDVCAEKCVHHDRIRDLRGLMREERRLPDLAALFKTLGDPTRVRILYALAHHELCVCDVAELLGMTPSAVSHQLRILRAAKMVRYRKEGKNVFYALDDEHVRDLILAGFDHVSEDGDPSS